MIALPRVRTVVSKAPPSQAASRQDIAGLPEIVACSTSGTIVSEWLPQMIMSLIAVVWTPHAQLFHYESASLGLPSGGERRAQFLEECANFKRIWADVIANDPFYNPNLTITGGDFSPAVPPPATKPWTRFAPQLRPAVSSTS